MRSIASTLAIFLLAPLWACRNSEPIAFGHADVASSRSESLVCVAPVAARPPVRSQAGPWMDACPVSVREPSVEAQELLDESRYEEALACAAQASVLSPEKPLPHAQRGLALAALDRFDESQLAYARALALDPENLPALLGAARLYAELLPSTRERDELAVLYSERGLALSQAQHNEHLMTQFALLSAMAFNDLGDSRRGLERAEHVLAREPRDSDAHYERAVALFELCRFDEAKAAFAPLLSDPRHRAYAHHHLGLLLERQGSVKEAAAQFALARKLAPQDFPPVPKLSPSAFRAEVSRALEQLPQDVRGDLDGIPISTEELPKDDDLLSTDPPLSPGILGLFRGPPLGESCDQVELTPCRSVSLYRRNLTRAVRNRKELQEQIRVTLLHEAGHLRGEDDLELAARGLE